MTPPQSNRPQRPETIAAQALGWVDEATGALVPPVHAASTYERAPDNSYPTGYYYSRSGNPTYAQLSAVMTALEGGAGTLLFGSGMAAATSCFLALAPGDHVVVQDKLYWGLRRWLNLFGKPWGLAVDFVAAEDPAAVEAAMKPGRTKLVWVETPANPTWEVVDLVAIAGIAHAGGARLAVDATASTPALTRPIEHGADLVMHAATKYLNGHSDVIAGVVVGARADAYWERLEYVRKEGGGVLGPFEAWLVLRGLRTLHLRVRRASATALRLATWLSRHPAVAATLYPGLPSHPTHAVARRQMTGGFGGMLSLRVRGGEAAAIRVAARLQVFKRATSFGGVESLVEHRASIEGEGSPVPLDLLRLSVGIEDADDLIADLARALDAAG